MINYLFHVIFKFPLKKMKSFLLSLFSCVTIAYTGAFIEVWTLPQHRDMVTVHDVIRKLQPMFKFTDGVREIRNGRRAKTEAVFAEKH